MISGEFKNHVVRIEADNEPRLELGDQVVLVTSLSGAQKRAFGLAFTLAIADVSGQQAPIVIDTPVGNMDSEYRARVLEYVSQAANGQVIYLSHDEEISSTYARALKKRVAKTFLVEFEPVGAGNGTSVPIEDKYFEGVF